MERLLSFPLLFPSEFTGWLPQHIGLVGNIPDSAIVTPAPDDWHVVGDAGEPAFQNSWVNFDAGGTREVSFTKRNGFVSLRGVMKSGTVNTTAFTLPAAYCHDEGGDIAFPVIAGGAFGFLVIGENGNVKLQTGSNAYVFLYGVTFAAAT